MPTNLNKILNKDLSVLLYKIFNDTLFLLLIAYFMLLLAEGLIPGFSSSFLSFTKMTLLIFANLGLVIYLGKMNNITFPALEIKKNKLWLAFFLIFFTFLLTRALYKFSLWEIVIIVITSLAILYYLYYNYYQEYQRSVELHNERGLDPYETSIGSSSKGKQRLTRGANR